MNYTMGVIYGSKNDKEKMAGAVSTFELFGIEVHEEDASAHRSPDRVAQLARTARENGFYGFVCGAGLAAHLAGAVAANTTLPVIGVPLSGGIAGGLDALLSTVQMPKGVVVGCVGVDNSRNAALLLIHMLSVTDPSIAAQLDDFRAGGFFS